MNSVLEFIEKNTPNYHENTNVVRMDDLSRYLNGELTEENIVDYGLSGVSTKDAFSEFLEIQDNLFEKAFFDFECSINSFD